MRGPRTDDYGRTSMDGHLDEWTNGLSANVVEGYVEKFFPFIHNDWTYVTINGIGAHFTEIGR